MPTTFRYRFWSTVARAAGIIVRAGMLRAMGKRLRDYDTLSILAYPQPLDVVLVVPRSPEAREEPVVMTRALIDAGLAALRDYADEAPPCENPDCPVCAPKRAGKERTTPIH